MTTTAPATDVLVLERSAFMRSMMLNQAPRLGGALYMHADVPKAAECLRTRKPGWMFVSRKVLAESDEAELVDLVTAIQQSGVRCAVMVGRAEARDVGRAPPFTVEWYLLSPFPPEVLHRLVKQLPPDDECAIRPGERAPAARSDLTPIATAVPPVSSPAALELRKDRLLNTDLERLDHFELLDVPATATRREILNAYLTLVRRFHPDLAASIGDARLAQDMNAVYRRVAEAWQVLGDDERRSAYIATRRPGGAR